MKMIILGLLKSLENGKIMSDFFILLGGNILNLGIYEKLMKQNYFVIIVDWSPTPSLKGKMHLQIDVKDYDSILAKIIEFNIPKVYFKGCYTSIDLAVVSVVKIYEFFGYVYGGEHYLNAINKGAMTNIWKNAGQLLRNSSVFVDYNDLILDSHTSYIIIKPNSSASSRAITIVNKKDVNKIKEAFYLAKLESYDQKVIIEDFIEGTEYTVEMLIDVNGKASVYAISKKYHNCYLADNKVAIKLHYNPIDIPSQQLHEIASFGKKCFEALNLVNCFGHFEMIIDRNGRYHPIEIGARSSGFIASTLVDKVSKRDYFFDFLDTIFKDRLSDGDKYISDMSSMYYFYFFKPGTLLKKDASLLDYLPATIKSEYSNRSKLKRNFLSAEIKDDNARPGYEILYGPKNDLTIENIVSAEQKMISEVTI